MYMTHKGDWSRVQEHDQYRENFDNIKFGVRKGTKAAKPTQKHKDKKKEAKNDNYGE
jgi:hypothetical protein